MSELSGTATDDVLVTDAQAAVFRHSDFNYWNGVAWVASESWLTTTFTDPSWTYGTLPSWTHNETYSVVSRAVDSSANWSLVYSTHVFHFDTALPVSGVTVPAHNSFPASVPSIAGTASDSGSYPAQVWVRVRRILDGYHWNGSLTQWTAAEAWNLATGSNTWTYGGLPQAQLNFGATYYIQARAADLASNVQTAEVAGSTFVFYGGSPLPPGCAAAVTVKSGGGGDYTAIQDALDALPKNLTGNTCVVVTPDGTYNEEVTVQGFTNNGYRLIIMREPGGGSPQVSPPGAATAVFRVMNSSVTIAGFDAIPSAPGPYGVYASSDNVTLSSVSVVSAGSINAAGIRLAGDSEILDSGVTSEFSHGIQLDGGRNLVARTGVTMGDASFAALYLSGSSSNTVTGSSFHNEAGDAVALLNGSDRNLVEFSTITSNSANIAFHADNSDLNTLTRSYVANPAGYGAFLGFGSDGNNISSSTILSEGASYFAVKLQSVSDNSLAYNFFGNAFGTALTVVFSSYTSVDNCVVASTAPAYPAVFVDASYQTALTNSSVSGAEGFVARASTGAAAAGSSIAAFNAAGAGFRAETSVGVSSLGNDITAAGTGILLGPGDGGAAVLSSNTVKGAQYGVKLYALAAGASLEVSSLTLSNMSPGATGIEFLGGQFVSTFSGVAFNSSSVTVNVDGALLAAGSLVTMKGYTGQRGGPAYENDPSGYVDWDGADITAPTAAILQPAHLAYLNSLTLLHGTADDNVAVASVTVSIFNLPAGQYWDGSAWGAGQAWLDASIWPSSWTYTTVPAWVESSSYVVAARAVDAAGNWTVAYATNVFTYDLAAPLAAITSPASGTYASFLSVQGTAADLRGVALVQVGVRRESDGQYWDGAAWAAGPLWNNSTGTLSWTYNGIAQGDLANNATYLFMVRAADLAGNLSDPALGSSTFTFVVPPGGALSTAPFSGVGISSLTVNWTTTHSTAAVYQVRLSSWAGEAPFLYAGSTHTTSIDFTGLTPDTSYYGFVSTIPGSGFVPGGFGVTLASAPALVDFSSVAYTSATLTWAAGANPAWTVYELELSTAADFSALASSAAAAALSYDFTGLQQWMPYYGRARAVNQAGVRSPWVEAQSSALTLFVMPTGSVTGLAGAPQGVSSITWTWSSGTVTDADYYSFYSGAGVFLGTVTFAVTGTFEQEGLQPNTSAQLRVRGRNGFGEGPLTNSAAIFTLAAVPASPAFGAVGLSSVTLGWTAAGNPAGTVYEYQLSEQSDFSSTVASGSGPGLSALFTGLAQGATYYGRVRAVNGDSVATAWAQAPQTVTGVLLPSGLPASLAGAALGVSSVSWSWSAGSVAAADYFVIASLANVQLSTAAFGATGAYIREGLGPNSPQQVRVGGLNAMGRGPLLESATVYTLALPPAAPAAAAFVSSAALTLGLGGNPAGTVLQLWRSPDNGAYASVYEGAALSYADAGLAECSPYYYKARARNGGGLYSAFGGTTLFITQASTPLAPGGLYAEALDGARIALVWEPSPTASVSRYSVYYDNAGGVIDYSVPLAVFSSTVTSWTTPVLSAGSTYKFAVRAGGGCGAEEKNTYLAASAQAVGVLSGVRAAIKVPQAGKHVKGNSLTVVAELSLGVPAQVAQVRFQYSPAGAGAWTDIAAVNPNHPNPDLAWPYFVHLDADALGAGTYDLRAVATDIYSVADPAAPTVTFVVDPVDFEISENVSGGEQRKEQKVVNTVTSTLQAADDASALVSKVVIPAGAVTDSTAALTLVSNPATVPAPPSGAEALNIAIKVNLSNGQSQLSGGKTAALSFTYKDDDNNGLVDGTMSTVERLRVYTAPDGGGAWTQLVTTVDRANKTVTAVTPHFSFFSVFAAPAAGLNSARVYPVPWQPGTGGRFDAAGVTFSGLPQTARIRIYTIVGELVRELEVAAADAGQKIWDGRNSEGHKVASGIYLALVKSGSDERTLKVAVER